MKPAAASIVRVIVALAMCFGVAAQARLENCASPATMQRCACCENPGASACCAASENRAPQQQPAAPSPRASLEGQPAALAPRTAMNVMPPVAEIHFPEGKTALCAGAARHAFHSLNCIWTV